MAEPAEAEEVVAEAVVVAVVVAGDFGVHVVAMVSVSLLMLLQCSAGCVDF